jgi:ubiquinone/menaquinone biosynthesis C-methylase UbiE
MPKKPGMLTHEQATCFYNRLGAKQDWQAFFETPATRDLVAHAAFESAQAVFEFGCGTGAFAERVLSHHLPQEATYLAVDSSETMVRLAQSRLARFGERVTVRQTDGSLQFGEGPGSCDRFVSNYVLDLLSPTDIAHLLEEARRLLVADGRLGLVSLTAGSTPTSRLVSWIWTHLYALDPRLVGGCRLLDLRSSLPPTGFHLDYVQVVTRFGVPSQVLVARRKESEDSASEERRRGSEAEQADSMTASPVPRAGTD